MILPLKLTLEDITRIAKDKAEEVYYTTGAKFVTNQASILANCKLDSNQKATVMDYPPTGDFRLVTLELGTFNLEL